MMKLEFNEKQLSELMKDFYISSGIRIVLFDDEYQELLSYPPCNCLFCQQMKSRDATRKLCAQSDIDSFRQCDSSRKLIIYHCHAGLIEATIPLLDDHIIIGYLMFGQISDCQNRTELRTLLQSCLERYGQTGQEVSTDLAKKYSGCPTDFNGNTFPPDLTEDFVDSTSMPDFTTDITADIPLKTEEQIHAAAKIMEACTFYALFNETIALRRHNFTTNLRTFLLEHLTEPLDAETIAGHLGISRSKLYLTCDKYLGIGIAEYLRNLRIEKARMLLRTTSMTITEISAEVGFGDYNYFCKVFKKNTGVTPHNFRTSL